MKRRGDKVSRRAVRALANADSFAASERARLTITAADTRSQRSPKTVKFDTVFAAHFGPAPIHAKNARTSSVACAEAASTPNVAREHSPNQGTKPATAAYGRVRNRVYHIGVTCRNSTAGTAGKASALRPLAQLAHRPRSRCRAREAARHRRARRPQPHQRGPPVHRGAAAGGGVRGDRRAGGAAGARLSGGGPGGGGGRRGWRADVPGAAGVEPAGGRRRDGGAAGAVAAGGGGGGRWRRRWSRCRLRRRTAHGHAAALAAQAAALAARETASETTPAAPELAAEIQVTRSSDPTLRAAGGVPGRLPGRYR